MNSQALSMDEPKAKLVRLEELIPNAPDNMVYEFGRYLAGYLNSQLVPPGFVMGCDLALHDLHRGVNGFTGEPIRNGLVGYPSAIYALLRAEIPDIADAIFPAEFATAVKDFLKKVTEST